MKPEFKKLLPHLYVILFFLAITLVYFSPVMQGKAIRQHDIAQWEGMSKEIQDFRDKYHTEPLWTNSMFGGMPAYQISVNYPNNLLRFVDSILTVGLPAPVSYIFLSLVGFYLLILCLGINYNLAAAGAIGFAFASYNFIIIVAGHNSKIHAIALAPLVLAGIMMVFNRKYLLGGAVTAIALGLEVYANHLQITYYLALAIGILLIVEVVKLLKSGNTDHLIKSGATLAIATVMALLPNITSLWATYEYGKESTRGPSELTEKKESTGLDKNYALGWSYGIAETMTLLIPDFMGGASQQELGRNSATYKALVDNGAGQQANSFIKQAPLYWGDMPYTSGPNYNGAIMIFLFVVALYLVKNEYKWWLLSATLLFVLLSWGKNFMAFTDIFFNYVPGYNKFRAVSMNLAMVSLTIPLLAVLGLERLFNKDVALKEKQKALKMALYITGGLCLVFAIAPGIFFSFSSPADSQFVDRDGKQIDWLISALVSDRESTLRTDAFRSLFFIGASFFLITFWLRNKINFVYTLLGLGLLTLTDMWGVNKRYLNNSNFVAESKAKQPFQPTRADQMILADTDLDYRVMNTAVSTFNDASTSYFHKSIGGYHGAKLKRYQELIEYQISKNNMAVLDMLNTRYIILQSKEDGQPIAQRNPGALGNAWYVDEVKMVPDADGEIAALTGLVPAHTAVVDKRFESYLSGFHSTPDSLATIKLTEYLPNHLTYTTNTSTEQLAVFSEIYYDKGWNAYVDGKPAPHIRTDYVLRAMRIPAGKHMVEFKFEPKVYQTGETIALAGSIVLLLTAGFALFREFKNRNS
ncbi:MAG TPA: YfhO family protein [Bacteroidia bacterium]|nr:YfhO family protein [Bacteroidia bacterium]